MVMDELKNRGESAIFLEVASRYAEALLIPSKGNDIKSNVFGRLVQVNSKGGLSQLLGNALTGMRSAALIDSSDIADNVASLSSFCRNHVPLTLSVYGNGQAYLHLLINSGCIIFSARTAQEYSDMLLISQVISEKTLTPVVILSDLGPDLKDHSIPSSKELAQWFGNPDARVPDPTKAQEMVFGPERRRMPAWHHLDHPVFLGAKKDHEMQSLERASVALFDQSNYQEAINETFKAFQQLTSRNQELYLRIGPKKFRNAVITTALTEEALEDKDLLRKLDKNKTDLFLLKQLYPLNISFPDTIKDVEKIQVLEHVSDAAKQGVLFSILSASGRFDQAYKENGWFMNPPSAKALVSSLDHLLNVGSGSNVFWLDVPLTLSNSRYPKHEILIQQILRNYPDADKLEVSSASTNTNISIPGTIPGQIKRMANQGPPYAKVNRFYDDTFCLYEGAKDELIADPFQAYPVMPASSAAFSDQTGTREFLPVFNPELCDDIDGLILSCPFGALPSALITVADLIDEGIKQANSAGNPVVQLMPLKKKWLQASIAIAMDRSGIKAVKDILGPGFDEMMAASIAEDDSKQALRIERDNILNEVGQIPVVADKHLFVEQERREKGTGELFTIAVNPFTCSGCGHCAMTGDNPCMEMKDQSSQTEEVIRIFDRYDKLPITSEYSIERLVDQNEFDPFAALMLNKEFYQSFTSSSFEHLTQDETVVRYYLGLNALRENPKRSTKKEALNDLIDKLNVEIKNMLGNSLPVNHLDSLMEVLSGHEESRINMNEIFGEWGETKAFSSIEKSKLQRKLQLLNELKSLYNLLERGMTGQGRPSCTVILDKSLKGLANYPYNQFSVPVLYGENNDTAALALGACEGHIRNSIDEIRLLRRAKLEISDKYVQSKHDDELVGLTWEKLTDEERNSVQPVLLIAGKSWMTSVNNEMLMALLEKQFPVKVCLIDNGTLTPEHLDAQLQLVANDIWPFIAQGSTFIGRGTLAHRSYLYRLMKRSLNYSGPSILTVLSPAASAFNIHAKNWMELSALAVSSRAFLQMSYDPEKKSDSISSHIRAEVENIGDDYHRVQLNYMKGDQESSIDYKITWADWAFLQHEFASHFTKLESGENVIFIADLLISGGKADKEKIPAILRVNAAREAVYYAVSADLVKACDTVVRNTRVLREWAGLFTLYPEKLRKIVDKELREEYKMEKEKFESELLIKKAEWEANYLSELKKQMKETLLNMSGM